MCGSIVATTASCDFPILLSTSLFPSPSSFPFSFYLSSLLHSPSFPGRTILLDSLLDSFCSLYKCLASHINAQIALLRYCSARLDSSSQHGGSELQDSVTTLKTKLAEEQNLAFLTTIFHSSTTKLLASPNMEALEEVLPDAAKDGHVCAQVLCKYWCVGHLGNP